MSEREEDLTGGHSEGRFVKAFPLEFPMGIADLYEERARKVSVEEWVPACQRHSRAQPQNCAVGDQACRTVQWEMLWHGAME